MRTKRELLAQIKRGPTSVAAEYPLDGNALTIWFRIAVPDDDPDAHVRISLSADRYAVQGNTIAIARIGKHDIPLTRAEADFAASFVARTMKMREQPSGLS